MGEPLIHYELREFHGSYDLCRVKDTGMLVSLDAEGIKPDIVERIAKTFEAIIVPEGAQGTLSA